jgi:hypothetical protein
MFDFMPTPSTKSSSGSKDIEARPLEAFFDGVEKTSRGTSSASASDVAKVIRQDRDASS